MVKLKKPIEVYCKLLLRGIVTGVLCGLIFIFLLRDFIGSWKGEI